MTYIFYQNIKLSMVRHRRSDIGDYYVYTHDEASLSILRTDYMQARKIHSHCGKMKMKPSRLLVCSH